MRVAQISEAASPRWVGRYIARYARQCFHAGYFNPLARSFGGSRSVGRDSTSAYPDEASGSCHIHLFGDHGLRDVDPAHGSAYVGGGLVHLGVDRHEQVTDERALDVVPPDRLSAPA